MMITKATILKIKKNVEVFFVRYYISTKKTRFKRSFLCNFRYLLACTVLNCAQRNRLLLCLVTRWTANAHAQMTCQVQSPVVLLNRLLNNVQAGRQIRTQVVGEPTAFSQQARRKYFFFYYSVHHDILSSSIMTYHYMVMFLDSSDVKVIFEFRGSWY